MDRTQEIILGLLQQAAAAHGEYEADVLGGKFDEQWPQWYSAHMATALADAGYRIVED